MGYKKVVLKPDSIVFNFEISAISKLGFCLEYIADKVPLFSFLLALPQINRY